ncbi:MAG: sigma-54-dependent Fis family transcriptional regulator [Myxococcales bacterium]|nr:sigma-54-dependent Fis family transcriptional regulator [Myxococcales bacterium]
MNTGNAQNEAASTATLPPLHAAERIDLVFVVDGQTSVQPLPNSGRLVIGRGRESGVCVLHSSLSREHAALSLPGLVLEDLGSTNGTFVRRVGEDGRPIEVQVTKGQPVTLSAGDALRLGAVTLVLVPTYLRETQRTVRTTDASVVLEDQAMKAIHTLIERVAAADIPVLILGETGVGKEVLAETLHNKSPRARKTMVRLNCAALSESLLESELFGHEKGAFTGASSAKPGLIETADGGTILLDEIGDLSLGSQAKLLRVLEERKVIRVGGVVPRSVDVRFVAATHKDLAEAASKGTFRSDLYFRLAGVVLDVPPLRARPGEIVPLARAFVRAACHRHRRAVEPTFSKSALEFLQRYEWPGNVRELKHTVERAVLLCDGASIEREHLATRSIGAVGARSEAAPTSTTAPSAPPAPAPISTDEAPRAPSADATGGLPAVTADHEASAEEPHAGRPPKTPGLTRAAIERALEKCAGNQTRAAELLGISRRTLVTWLERYKIARPRTPKG